MFINVSEECAISILKVEDAGSTFLRNISKHLPHYTASHPRRQFHVGWLRSRTYRTERKV
jgi:hypothetical protein